VDNESFFNSVIDLIRALQDDPGAVGVLRDPVTGPEINLFDAGLLESLTVIQLLDAIEDSFGVQVPIHRYGMEDFFTLRSIQQMVEPLIDT
jgi:acyl carrier protein